MEIQTFSRFIRKPNVEFSLKNQEWQHPGSNFDSMESLRNHFLLFKHRQIDTYWHSARGILGNPPTDGALGKGETVG